MGMDTATETLLTTRLLGRDTVARDTLELRFEKPPGFDFRAGQAVDLVLPGDAAADRDAVRHAFSLVSAPYEPFLAIATRMRDSAFKRTLAGLREGAQVECEGPFGSLTLHKRASRAAAFIAGGIGITPFVSMLRQVAHEGGDRPIALLTSDRRPEDAAYLAEMQRLVQSHPRFRHVATMTAPPESWSGERGRIDAAMLARVTAGLPEPIHYVAGPPAMVAAVRATLAAAGVDDEDIRSEEFYGY